MLTDSLAMAAASSSLGISPAPATVRALRAGADWAMACDASPLRAVTAVRRALDAGTLDRHAGRGLGPADPRAQGALGARAPRRARPVVTSDTGRD